MSHKKFGPDQFSRFDVYWRQTNKQTYKPNLYIDNQIKKAIAFHIFCREGNYSISPDTMPEEINIYDGVNNRITFRRVYTKTFKVIILLLTLKLIVIINSHESL